MVRSEVRLNADQQRATASRNEFEKAKLQLARVIGLPIGQAFMLSEQLPNVPVPDMTVEQALERAYKERPDYLAAQERVKAAEATRAAAFSELLPSVRLTADYGAIGLTAPGALVTYSVAGAVNIPIFQGGRTQGRVAQADSDLRDRRAEAEDMRAQIYYDVRTAFLDLQATGEELQVATRSRDLANQELTQARDRFAAGVASNIELVEGAAVGDGGRGAVHRRAAWLRRVEGRARAVARRRGGGGAENSRRRELMMSGARIDE